MTEAILFLSALATVFLLGLQQFNIHNRRYLLAGITSLAIGIMNIAALKLIPVAGINEIVAYLAGGPFGVLLSMYINDNWLSSTTDVPDTAVPLSTGHVID